MEILKRYELYVASVMIVIGPKYTYLSGQSRTVVDYILLDAEAATTSVTSFTVYVNTYDHLPLSVHLALSAPLLSLHKR